MRISCYSTKDDKEVDRQLCDRVRRFIAQAITKEFSRFQNKSMPEMDPFFFQIQCTDIDTKDILDDGLHDLKGLTDLLDVKVGDEADIDASCTKHSNLFEPHSFKPVDLLKEWFPDKIPERLRKSKDTVIESWFKRLPQEKKDMCLKEQTISLLSSAIGKNWWSLMVEQLDVKKTLIDRCYIDNPREVQLQIFEVMKHWASKSTATNGLLLEAMFKAKDITVDFEEVQNIFDKI